MRDVVFLSPHLDDAALSCGGAISRIARGTDSVTIVTACTADPAHPAALSPAAKRYHASWAIGDTPFGERCAEDAEAARTLGARVVHLGFLDAMYRDDASGSPLYPRRVSRVVEPRDDDGFAEALREPLSRVLGKADTVFCPAGVGGHVDHVIVRSAVEEVCRPERVVYYEEYPYLSRRFAAGCSHTEPDPLVLTVLPLSGSEVACRVDAIACYRSQLRGLFPSRSERLAEIVSARVPVLGRFAVSRDRKAPVGRVALHLRRDLARCGGERYWSLLEEAERLRSPAPELTEP